MECLPFIKPCPGSSSFFVPGDALRTPAIECSGHGVCEREGDCRVGDSCSAVCTCAAGYLGSDCALTEAGMQSARVLRGQLLDALVRLGFCGHFLPCDCCLLVKIAQLNLPPPCVGRVKRGRRRTVGIHRRFSSSCPLCSLWGPVPQTSSAQRASTTWWVYCRCPCRDLRHRLCDSLPPPPTPPRIVVSARCIPPLSPACLLGVLASALVPEPCS